MAAIGLIALRDFTFAGITYREEEAFSVTPVEAAALTYQKKARFRTAADDVPQPAPPTSRTTRRAYRRRDLVAEPTMTPEMTGETTD